MNQEKGKIYEKKGSTPLEMFTIVIFFPKESLITFRNSKNVKLIMEYAFFFL